MAKATAECTCKTCGKVYTATKICRNRRDADEWEQWATEHMMSALNVTKPVNRQSGRRPTRRRRRRVEQWAGLN